MDEGSGLRYRGPAARRRYLGKVLRRLREANGMKTPEVAKLVRVSQPTVSRIEGGRGAIMARHVYRMLEVYGIDGPEADRIMQLAEQANEPGWWESYTDVIHDWFEIYASLESDTAEIWTYEVELIPGLFQTPDYIRALRLAAHPDSTPEQLDRSIQLRLERQQQLDAQNIVAVINEAAVRRLVGGRDVMRTQLRRLVDEAGRGRELRLLPFEAGAHAGMLGPFIMLRFADSHDDDAAEQMDLVYLEHERGSVYLERPADLLRYGDVFEQVRTASLSTMETAKRLTRLIGE
jgi:transcriptional regulator with XRE-family HTH domain